MGCFPFHILAPSRRKTIIKIVSADGRCLKFQAPLTVKEVLVDHPGHALFFCINPSINTAGSYCRSTSTSGAATKLSSSRASRPLPDTQSLQSGQIYFLIPLQPQQRHAPSLTTKPVLQDTMTSSSSTPPIEQPIKPPAPPSKMNRRVSFAPFPAIIGSSSEDKEAATEAEAEEEGPFVTERKTESAAVHDPAQSQPMEAVLARKPSLELLPPNSSNGAAAGVRLRMVVSKKQLEALLAGSEKDANAFLEGLLNPLINQAATIAASASSDSASSWTAAVNSQKHTSSSLSSSSSSWRPSIDCIPESPRVCNPNASS